jgi:hypothetical protein
MHPPDTQENFYWYFMCKVTPQEGWNELSTTNAPVEDDAVEAVLGMNQKYILPCQKLLVFSTSSLHLFK